MNGNKLSNRISSSPKRRRIAADVPEDDMFKEEINNKCFNDAIHGMIEIHPLCVKIVDTPQFQRLRFIKQVGSCYYVFPSAAHNRFEHCLGVCYLAGLLVKALKNRQPELGITEEDILCVKIAGLCHDLGHGPFSHLWNQFMDIVRPNPQWRHEDSSIQMFEYLIEVNDLMESFECYGLTAIDITFIKELISNNDKLDAVDWKFKGRPHYKSFLYEIVANKRNGVDVDKWDYILRDSHSLGLKMTFEYSRLVKFSRVILTPNEGLQICFRDKEVNNLYDMFHVRKNFHRIAYQHKVVKIIDAMILDALILADHHVTIKGSNGKLLCLSEIVDDPYAFTHLTDDIVNAIYRDSSKHHKVVKAKEIIHRIYTRKLYSFIGQTSPTNHESSKEISSQLFMKLTEDLPELDPNDLILQKIKIDYGMGSANPINNCRFFTKTEINISKIIRQDDASLMNPRTYQEERILVLLKKADPQLMEQAQLSFLNICDDLGLKKSQDEELGSLTPEKCSQPHSPEDNGIEL